MNIFERAARNKLRFPSDKGGLTTEQVFDLNLHALDTLARTVNTELKSITEESFVEVKPDPRKRELTLQLDILKHVIAAKMAAADAAQKRADIEARRKQLTEALGAKEEAELGQKSAAQLRKELTALEAAEAEADDA